MVLSTCVSRDKTRSKPYLQLPKNPRWLTCKHSDQELIGRSQNFRRPSKYQTRKLKGTGTRRVTFGGSTSQSQTGSLSLSTQCAHPTCLKKVNNHSAMQVYRVYGQGSVSRPCPSALNLALSFWQDQGASSRPTHLRRACMAFQLSTPWDSRFEARHPFKGI